MTSARRSAPLTAAARRDGDDDLIRDLDVAGWLDVSRRTLREWRYLGTGPAHVVIEGRIRYRRGDVRDYIDRNRTESGALN